MILDPVEALKKTSTLLVPTSTPPLSSIAPIPTVVPALPEYQHVHVEGTRTLWVVFVVMVVASLVFSGLSWNVHIKNRFYYIITTLITVTAALSYFAMASGHGVSYHHIVEKEHHNHVPPTEHDIYRQVFFARYIDWAITTPLLLIDLGILAGISGAHLSIAIIADLIMILTGLFAAYGKEDTPQKWGWYAIASIAYLVIIWVLVVNGRATATAKGGKVGAFFASLGGYTLLVWTAYPVIWGVADGGRHLSVDGEIIAYAVLDILAKPVFGAWLLLSHAKIPETNVELGGFWAYGVSSEGRIRVGDDDEGA